MLRPAIGIQATGETSALARGYAIASTDAGHRDEPGPVGAYTFGLDPQALTAKARSIPGVPWPGRTRPLCPYPTYANYSGAGSIEDAASFVCK